jgi:hypothetical protein
VTLPNGTVVGVTRIHMEEDSAKMNHQGAGSSLTGSTHSLIDFNRSVLIAFHKRARFWVCCWEHAGHVLGSRGAHALRLHCVRGHLTSALPWLPFYMSAQSHVRARACHTVDIAACSSAAIC